MMVCLFYLNFYSFFINLFLNKLHALTVVFYFYENIFFIFTDQTNT